MQFKYTATNTQGKKLNGTIHAANETAARTQLNNLGFSILALTAMEETTAVRNESELKKFAFEAIDKTGKKIVGTIPAKTPYLGYKRLAQEYHFNITYLGPENASEEMKQNWRATEGAALKKQYELESGTIIDPNSNEIENPTLLAEKQILIGLVDQIIQQIKQLIAQFETKISPEKRAQIEGYLDKLLRIKSSNNLDYIKHTTQELLKQIQNEELFLHESEHGQEYQSLVMESQKMLHQLDKTVAQKKEMGTQFKHAVEQLEKKIEKSNLNFINDWIRSIQKRFKPDSELAPFKTQLKALRSQKWDAMMIALKASKNTRAMSWENVKKIKTQEQEIQKKIKSLLNKHDQQNRLVKEEKEFYWIEEINAFTGWLLGFYLVYYFIGHYATQNELNWPNIFGIPLDLKESALFKYFLVITFLVHGAISLKVNFLRQANWINGILGIVTGVACLMVIFNF